ncbi:HAD-IIB family hydrolase [Sphingomonas nostoxanthinifaciens]|uniref:HAD-IIB family hydrolase n=1 Tax=Sphingomonas nostoxanthinifaciens TaxID=2872652 RepID=UPI001CC212D1|nr:HAD-IIB family hydrolase [Sphingomonas nostoxanthinifaciens]UAK23508.1 HAD-IIB family hydrolase [Sphingomonas nostoxanthinifaciens]
MKKLVAFDLDGTLALSKQPLDDEMASLLAQLLDVAMVDIISGGDWPQFEKQVISRMPADAKLANFIIQPTTGTKLYRFQGGAWTSIYAELFSAEESQHIRDSLFKAVKDGGFAQDQTWGEQVEDRGSQITFSALGQQAPLEAKDKWDPDHAKRRKLQSLLQGMLPDLSINMGGSTSIDITRKGVDKAYGLKKLAETVGIALDDIMFLGDAIFPGGNDYPAKQLGLDTVRVRDVAETKAVITGIVSWMK